MKLAILGHSPLALEAAIRFHLHGAAATWFIDRDDVSLFTSSHFDKNIFTTDLGLSVLKEIERSYKPDEFSWATWKSDYEKPLIDFLKAHHEIRFDEVVSVTKRFLAPGEKIPGRSRFLDLFRVIFKVNPEDFIASQKESNPETYQRLTDEFVNSLTSSIEMYQDFDLVLDFRNDLSKASASVSGRALGESRPMDKVHYALEALKESQTMKPSPDLREMALIGSDSLSAEILVNLSQWLKDPHSRLFIATTEEDPFQSFFASGDAKTLTSLQKLFDYMEIEFQKEIDSFTHKLREWQEMDDFVQAKIPKPAEPIPRLVFFSGHNVTAIDELIDRKRMFLTLEKPEFRDGKKQPENNALDLKTIGVDRILVSHAKKDLSKIELDANDVGFFSLTPSRPNLDKGWESDLDKLLGIEDEIFKLFSPADSH